MFGLEVEKVGDILLRSWVSSDFVSFSYVEVRFLVKHFELYFLLWILQTYFNQNLDLSFMEGQVCISTEVVSVETIEGI